MILGACTFGAVLTACGKETEVLPRASVGTGGSLTAGGTAGLGAETGGRSTLGGTGGAGGTNPADGIPPLHVEGRYLKDPTGHTVVLRGVALADPVDVAHRDAGLTTPALLERLTNADDGFYTRVVRLTVYPDIWLEDPEGYFRDFYDPVVERATELGLYVIVDWHEISDVDLVIERTAAFWEFMAPQYADRTNVLYEIFNEPMDNANPSWATWKAVAQLWVDQIRAVAPDNIILIGGPNWDQQIAGAATDPLVGDNLVYVGHIYPIAASTLLLPTSPIAQAAAEHPVMITEWGFRQADTEVAAGTVGSFGEPLRAFVEERGLSWTAWCADTVWAPTMFDADWNLLVGPGEMGGFVRDWLATRRNDDQPAW